MSNKTNKENLINEITQLRAEIEELQIKYINAAEAQMDRIEELLEAKQNSLQEKYNLIGK